MGGFILTVVVSALIAWLGASAAQDNIPGGFWGAWLAGIVGAWIGAYFPYFSGFGPVFFSIAIIPSIIGSAVGIALMAIFINASAKTTG